MTTPMPGFQSNKDFSMQPRGNGPAVASLICSLFGFCTFGVLGLIGIILGFVGLRRARETAKGGGMAVAGIVIGFITIFAGIGEGYGINAGYHAAKNFAQGERDTARRFVADLNKGDVDAAATESSGISKEELSADSSVLKGMGSFTDMTSTNIQINNNTCTLSGAATFSNGYKNYDITLIGSGGDWKVTSANFH